MQTMTFKIQGEFITRLARERLYQEHNLNYAIDLLMSCTQTDKLSDAEHLKLCIDILEGRKEIRGTYPEDDYGVYDTAPTKRTPGIIAEWDKREKAMQELERKFNLMVQKFLFVTEELYDYDIEDLNQKWHKYMYNPDDTDEAAMPAWLFPDHASATELDPVLGAFERLFSSDSDNDNDTPVNQAGQAMLADFLKAQRVNRGDDYGWLSPSGEWHPVDWGEHQAWAANYLKEHPTEFNLPTDELKLHETVTGMQIYGEAGDTLNKRGWILLHSPHHGIAKPTRDETTRITKRQRDFLYGYYTDRGLNSLAQQYMED